MKLVKLPKEAKTEIFRGRFCPSDVMASWQLQSSNAPNISMTGSAICMSTYENLRPNEKNQEKPISKAPKGEKGPDEDAYRALIDATPINTSQRKSCLLVSVKADLLHWHYCDYYH